VRRQLNQAVFVRFWSIDDWLHGADHTETFAHLLVSAPSGSSVEAGSGE
jgi:hypothetical protein